MGAGAPESGADQTGDNRVRLPVSPAELGRVARRPQFIVGHLMVLALSITMFELGRWQWSRAHIHHGSIQNYGYAFQWWIFTAFGVLMWLRIMRDKVAREKFDLPAVPTEVARESAVRASAAALPTGYRAYVMPQSGPTVPVTASAGASATDPVLAGYNAYLAQYGNAATSAPPPTSA